MLCFLLWIKKPRFFLYPILLRRNKFKYSQFPSLHSVSKGKYVSCELSIIQISVPPVKHPLRVTNEYSLGRYPSDPPCQPVRCFSSDTQSALSSSSKSLWKNNLDIKLPFKKHSKCLLMGSKQNTTITILTCLKNELHNETEQRKKKNG